jgi:EpsI family protein
MVQEHSGWVRTTIVDRSENLGSRALTLREMQIERGGEHLLVWQSNWISGQFVVNNYVGKLLQTCDKLKMAGDDGASLMVYAPYNENPEEARVALRNFLSTNLGGLETTLAANRKS